MTMYRRSQAAVVIGIVMWVAFLIVTVAHIRTLRALEMANEAAERNGTIADARQATIDECSDGLEAQATWLRECRASLDATPVCPDRQPAAACEVDPEWAEHAAREWRRAEPVPLGKLVGEAIPLPSWLGPIEVRDRRPRPSPCPWPRICPSPSPTPTPSPRPSPCPWEDCDQTRAANGR